jgi:hypothetical protein
MSKTVKTFPKISLKQVLFVSSRFRVFFSEESSKALQKRVENKSQITKKSSPNRNPTFSRSPKGLVFVFGRFYRKGKSSRGNIGGGGPTPVSLCFMASACRRLLDSRVLVLVIGKMLRIGLGANSPVLVPSTVY